MALLRTRLFAGALVAGALFGASETAPPVAEPVSGGTTHVRPVYMPPYIAPVPAMPERGRVEEDEAILLALLM